MEDDEKQYKNQSRSNNYAKEILKSFETKKSDLISDKNKFSRQKRAVIKDIGDFKNKKILEYGSGNGLFSIFLSKLGAHVIGIDIGKDIVKLSQKAAQINSVKCDFLVGDIKTIPFKNETFDYVIGHGVLHHLTKSWLRKAINEAYRVLKPKRKAYFTEPVENSRIFNYIQNIIPVNFPNTLQRRPSILQRKKWQLYSKTVDDRALTDGELKEAKGLFNEFSIDYYGFLIRLSRIYSGYRFVKFLEKIDFLLTHKFSPVKKLSQCVLVCYSKLKD